MGTTPGGPGVGRDGCVKALRFGYASRRAEAAGGYATRLSDADSAGLASSIGQ
jgi:hypothetical protein